MKKKKQKKKQHKKQGLNKAADDISRGIAKADADLQKTAKSMGGFGSW